MRFMILVKASKESEAGVMPEEKLLGDMATFNGEMINAGVLLAGDGLHPSSKGARVTFDKSGTPTVTEGPFAVKDLVSGYWMIKVQSRDEALDWVRRIPFVDGEVEVRQVFELEDFAPSEAVDRHAQLRDQFEQKK